MAEVLLQAYAKVNLALALAAPEPPGAARAGWHRICTWMHAIDLADEVYLEPLPEGGKGGEGGVSTWSASWAPDAPRPGLIDWPCEQDLAWRALRVIEEHLGRRLPTRIVLTKRIPTGSGLGGGSADAAATLLGIDRAWGLGLGLDTLGTLGTALGSDVPFFLDSQTPPRPGVVRGFGETIERTSRIEGEILLLIPRFGCPTGRVYAAFDALVEREPGWHFAAARVRTLATQGENDSTTQAAELFNDLASPACAVQPRLGELLAKATEVLGCPVHVSGSGSTLFVLPAEGQAASLLEKARQALPEVALWPTRLC